MEHIIKNRSELQSPLPNFRTMNMPKSRSLLSNNRTNKKTNLINNSQSLLSNTKNKHYNNQQSPNKNLKILDFLKMNLKTNGI